MTYDIPLGVGNDYAKCTYVAFVIFVWLNILKCQERCNTSFMAAAMPALLLCFIANHHPYTTIFKAFSLFNF